MMVSNGIQCRFKQIVKFRKHNILIGHKIASSECWRFALSSLVFLKCWWRPFLSLNQALRYKMLFNSPLLFITTFVFQEINRKLLRFFFLNFILFLVSISLSIYAVVQSRKNILGRNLSRKAVFRYKKSFVNESETIASEQNMENDSTFPIDQTSLTSNSLRSRNGSSQAYTVAV